MTKKDLGAQGATAVEAAGNTPEGQLSHAEEVLREIGNWERNSGGWDVARMARFIDRLIDYAIDATHRVTQPAWQDIATAPKDGTAIVSNTYAGYVRIANVDQVSVSEFDGESMADIWCDPASGNSLHPQPTHWTPLLAPPEAK